MTKEELANTECKDMNPRRTPTLDGRLGLARRHCGRFFRKINYSDCEGSTTGLAGVSKKDRPASETCNKENLYKY